MMSRHPDAILSDEHGRAMLRFERVLAHSPERVWQALTQREQLEAWHPTPFDLQGRQGGSIAYVEDERWPTMGSGEVIAYDPPSLLEHTWGDDLLRWELRPHGDGCLLLLTHVFDDRMKAARDAAGWHLCIEALEASLSRKAHSEQADADGPPSGWRELNAQYQQRFRISPEQATPPPSR
jgi:uncharacterized protein YndB with AHSA1/START domain